MKRNYLLTPEGTRDFLFEECAAKRVILGRITKMFEEYGYSEVVTPGIEFYDVFNGQGRCFPQESMYKLVDEKNRLMVLRPDSTTPIARLCATRLRGEELPLKLFYNQNIFMVNPKDSGRDDEISQCGIEIIGGEDENSDYEALFLAAKALSVCDEDYRIEIGDSGIFRTLISEYDCTEAVAENIRSLIEAKDYPMLDTVLEDGERPIDNALRMLPRLFGGLEVFKKAKEYLRGEVLEAKLSRLEKLCADLSEIVPAEKIRVDLGLVHKKSYYTGIIFRGYVEGYGQPALSGGRYDALLETFGTESTKAVGFAVNVEAAARVFLKNAGKSITKSADVLVFSENKIAALKHCEELISEGLTVMNFIGKCPKCAEKYAKSHNISRLDIIDENGSVNSKEV